jgi:FixJ family two-component response regulator
VRQIRADLPIVIITGHGGAQLAQKAAAVCAKEVLHKPLRGNELAEAIARVLLKPVPATGKRSENVDRSNFLLTNEGVASSHGEAP